MPLDSRGVFYPRTRSAATVSAMAEAFEAEPVLPRRAPIPPNSLSQSRAMGTRSFGEGTIVPRRRMAEGAGFEPAIRFTVCTLSKRVP